MGPRTASRSEGVAFGFGFALKKSGDDEAVRDRERKMVSFIGRETFTIFSTKL